MDASGQLDPGGGLCPAWASAWKPLDSGCSCTIKGTSCDKGSEDCCKTCWTAGEPAAEAVPRDTRDVKSGLGVSRGSVGPRPGRAGSRCGTDTACRSCWGSVQAKGGWLQDRVLLPCVIGAFPPAARCAAALLALPATAAPVEAAGGCRETSASACEVGCSGVRGAGCRSWRVSEGGTLIAEDGLESLRGGPRWDGSWLMLREMP